MPWEEASYSVLKLTGESSTKKVKTNVGLNLIPSSLFSSPAQSNVPLAKWRSWYVGTDLRGVWIGRKIFIRKYAWKSQTVVLSSIPVSEEHILKNKVTSKPGTPTTKLTEKNTLWLWISIEPNWDAHHGHFAKNLKVEKKILLLFCSQIYITISRFQDK